jgi:LiaI-LiaF-like transmembrane region/B-box zinc finger
MNCANHPEAEVSAYCRSCGKALCVECRKDAAGTVYCADHAPVAEPEPVTATAATADANTATMAGAAAAVPPAGPVSMTPPPPPPFAGSPYSAAAPPPPGGTPYVHPTTSTPSPALAFILGFIPGVGAIYNGQYAKGLVHAVVFGLIITILTSGHVGNFEPLFGIFLAIWIFYMAFEAHHTAAKRRSGEKVDELSSLMNIPGNSGGVPVGPVVLIGLGVLMLLDTLDLISFERVSRYWPLLLIAGGAYMLYVRVEGRVRNDGR